MLEKTHVKQAFSSAAGGYDSVARLQREVGGQLLQHLEACQKGGVLLDLGCGTGFLTAALLERFPGQTIIGLDLAFAMLKTARHKLGRKPLLRYLCADAERLPLTSASIDMVASNLALQWCAQPSKAFAELYRVLTPGGQLLFSTFGDGSLRELKNAWAEVDNYRHVNEFYADWRLRQFVREAGFHDIRCYPSVYRLCYPDVIDLLRELKQLGAQTVMAGRRRNLTGKRNMQAMMEAYRRQGNGQIMASFHVITLTANR